MYREFPYDIRGRMTMVRIPYYVLKAGEYLRTEAGLHNTYRRVRA